MCLKAHFMKEHPAEYKEKYGVDPRDIQAQNVPNPRIKRPYHRKAHAKPDMNSVDKQNLENQNSKPLKNGQKIDKLKKKVESLIIEAPKPVTPKSKKDRLRPMPPHLLAKEMEAQEAREKAERERQRLAEEQENARREEERIREQKLKEEEERVRKLQEERELEMKRQLKEQERLKAKEQEEDARKAQEAKEKENELTAANEVPPTSAGAEMTETLSTEMTVSALQLNSTQPPPVELQTQVVMESRETEADNVRTAENEVSPPDKCVPLVPKPLFVATLLNSEVVDPMEGTERTQHAEPMETDAVTSTTDTENFAKETEEVDERQDLETTTIDLSQLQEVTTPIFEEGLHRSPFKGLHGEKTSGFHAELTTSNSSHSVQQSANPAEFDKASTEPLLEKAESNSSSGPAEESSTTDLRSSSPTKGKSVTIVTPTKSPPKPRKPRTPKSVQPQHRILTRRTYARDEEERFKAEREAAPPREPVHYDDEAGAEAEPAKNSS